MMRGIARDPNRYNAELHDRLIAPFYPIAFATIAFAWLGAPSTTRQNRTMSMVSMTLAVFVLRLAGFLCQWRSRHYCALQWWRYSTLYLP